MNIDRVLFSVTKSPVKKWVVLARRKYTDYNRPLAAGPIRNAENMESLLNVSYMEFILYIKRYNSWSRT